VRPIARLFSPTVDRSLSSSFSFSFFNRSTRKPSTDEVTDEAASALGSAETVAVVGGGAQLPAAASGLATRSSVDVWIWVTASGTRWAARLELVAALMVVVVRSGARLPLTAAMGVTTGSSVGVRILAAASGSRWAPRHELAVAPSAARPKHPRRAVLGRASHGFFPCSNSNYAQFFCHIIFKKKYLKIFVPNVCFPKNLPLSFFIFHWFLNLFFQNFSVPIFSQNVFLNLFLCFHFKNLCPKLC
jgi:hypothetical protein